MTIIRDRDIDRYGTAQSLADPVSHSDLQVELSLLREAIAILALAAPIASHDLQRLMALIAPPHERAERC